MKQQCNINGKCIVFLCSLYILFSGCVAMKSISTSPDEAFSGSIGYYREPYGGVKADWYSISEMGHLMAGPYASLAGMIMVPYIVDLPLSAIVDTVALPYTIPYTMARNNRLSTQEQEKPTNMKKSRTNESTLSSEGAPSDER